MSNYVDRTLYVTSARYSTKLVNNRSKLVNNRNYNPNFHHQKPESDSVQEFKGIARIPVLTPVNLYRKGTIKKSLHNCIFECRESLYKVIKKKSSFVTSIAPETAQIIHSLLQTAPVNFPVMDFSPEKYVIFKMAKGTPITITHVRQNANLRLACIITMLQCAKVLEEHDYLCMDFKLNNLVWLYGQVVCIDIIESMIPFPDKDGSFDFHYTMPTTLLRRPPSSREPKRLKAPVSRSLMLYSIAVALANMLSPDKVRREGNANVLDSLCRTGTFYPAPRLSRIERKILQTCFFSSTFLNPKTITPTETDDDISMCQSIFRIEGDNMLAFERTFEKFFVYSNFGP